MRLGLGLGLAGPQAAAGSPSPAENLLTWTEEFQNAAWVKTNASVIADANSSPFGEPTADQVTFGPAGGLRQTTTTAATTGSAASSLVDVDPSTWARRAVTGIFDGQSYCFSVYLRGASTSVLLRIERSEGFLRADIVDGGDETSILVWGAQLETGTGPTEYVARTT